jgi:hypothetical protein
VPLILVFEVVAGAVVAGAVVAGACVAGAVVAAPPPEFLVGLALFVAVGFVVTLALAEDDDEADAFEVAPGPAIGPPAIFIALVVPN